MARKLDWTPSFVHERAPFPEEMSGRLWLPQREWAGWDEPERKRRPLGNAVKWRMTHAIIPRLMAPDTAQARDARRRQLLEVALTLFAEKGYHATTIADIIEHASVARGTFYNYFDSKRHIFGRLLDELFEVAFSSAFPIAPGRTEDVHSQVRANISAICASLSDNLPMTRVLLQQAVGLDEEANEQLHSFYDRVLTRLQLALDAGQAMGIVRPGNSSVLATCVLGMLKESLYQRLLGTRTAPLEHLVEEIFETAARGILVAGAG